jgi:hypothetical protein
VVLAARGQTGFAEMFRGFVGKCPLPVVEVGLPGQAIATDLGAWDLTSHGFLEMTWIISQCRFFVGLMSAPLVVASGFPCFKIAPHDGQSWDMRHVVRTPLHAYPVGKDPQLILDHLR